MTLEPGPDSQRTWRNDTEKLFSDDSSHHPPARHHRGGFSGRGGRGRGAHHHQQRQHDVGDEKLRGPWNREKGDRQARDVLARLKQEGDAEVSEGLAEFVTLCAIKFGR